MAIIKTVYDDYEFWSWLKQSDNYSNHFSCEGARALQEYMDNLSDDIGENIEFDPIAWCCDYSEYSDLEDFCNSTGYAKEDYKTIEDLRNSTTVIEFDGGLIVQDF